MEGRTVLATKSLAKSFGAIRAVAGVSLDFRAGEVHALAGENGAGKSTLIKMLSGHTVPDEGTIVIDGVEHREMTPKGARDLGIGVIYQDPSLVGDLSVAENVFMGALPHKGLLVDRKAMEREAKAIFEDLGVAIDVRATVSGLSVSQRQFVEVARVVAAHARLIVFDEPTAPLTDADAELLFALIGRLREQGTAVVYISHRLAEIYRLADRVTVMRDGRVVATRDTATLPQPELIRLMVGRDLTEVYPARSSEQGKEVLRAENLTTESITNVSFSLHEGEIVGLAGLAGSGRTETLRALFGADPLVSGTVELEGQKVRFGSPEAAVSAGLGYVPEDRKRQGLLMELPIRDNISLPTLKKLSHGGLVDRRSEGALVEHFSDALSIKSAGLDQEAGSLSGGNQQKVVVSKWLASRSKILIFDEPTQGIDVGAKHEIYRMMRKLCSEGYAIIMASSEMEELMGMADRILVLHEGEVAGTLSDPSDYSQERIMRYASGLTEEVAA